LKAEIDVRPKFL